MRRSSRVPLVARSEQVAAFSAALDRAAGGEPGVLLIGGDAGVGKTRLVTHLDQVARETGARVVTAHCVDLGEVGIPYLPFTEALTELLDVPAVADVVEQRPALARLLDPAGGASTGGDHGERLQLLDGAAGSLAAAGSPDAPLVLILEDVHWADASTRDVLRFLVARLRAEHLLLVVTYRSDDVDRRHPLRPVIAELHRQRTVEHLELAPFTRDELREFATAVKDGEPLAERELDDVLRRSEGNAFFAEELLDAGLPSAGLPWSLAEMLQTRLAHLDPQVQQLVQLAAVAGRQVDEELLRATAARLPGLSEPDAVDAALREAVAHQVLGVEGQNVAFRHALVAEALALDLLPGERGTLHKAYLGALVDDAALGSAALRAHHALAGHVLPVALTASYEAAREADEVLAPAEVLRHLERVLTLWDSVPDAAAVVAAEGRFGDDGEDPGEADIVSVLLAAARAASNSGQPARAVQLAQQALEVAGAVPARQARLRYQLARYLLDADRDAEAGHQCDLALEVLPGDASRELAWTLAVRSRAALDVEDDELARRLARRAVQVARDAAAPAPEADALASLAVLEVGDPDEAARLLEAARERAREADALHTELRCWYSLASTHFYAGKLDDARQVVDDGLARSRELGVPWTAYSIALWMLAALIPYFRGDLTDHPVPRGIPASSVPLLDSARQYAAVARGDEDAIERAETLREHWCDDGQVALLAGGTHADALTWAGRYDDAVAVAEEVATYLGETWSEFFLGRIWITALALAALADGAESRPVPADRAEDLLRRADDLLAVARQTAQRGRPRGGRLGPEGRAWLQRATAEHARLHAAVTGTPADPSLWEAAVREFGFGYRYEVARARFRWAQALRAAGDTAAAEVEAVESAAEAEAMGAAPLAAAVHAWARRARVTLPGARRTSSVLTEREEEVLALVAQGLSNRQIGEKLYISTKTVSVHVSNVLAKLGVSGRAEAVAVAHRRGLLNV